MGEGQLRCKDCKCYQPRYKNCYRPWTKPAYKMGINGGRFACIRFVYKDK